MATTPYPLNPTNDQEEDLFDYYYNHPGSAPGTLGISANALPTEIDLIDYNPEQVICRSQLTIEECHPYLESESVSWIDVQGLGSENVLREMGRLLGLPLLILEDIVNVPQRPKLEYHANFVVIILQTVLPKKEKGFWNEQISLIVGKNHLITVQEEPLRDPFDSVRRRIREDIGQIRHVGADYLAYALIDAVIDNFFPVLDTYSDRLEKLEEEVVEAPTQKSLAKIYRIRREILALRRSIWPQRELLNTLLRDGSPYIKPEIVSYLRDCYDHTVQIIDIIETYHELSSGLMDVYLSATGNKMNEIMKVLTIISTIFIPLTFIVGVYGMNFNPDASRWNMPELNYPWGYLICWTVMIAIAISQIFFFWRRGWFKNISTLRRKK